MKKRITLTIVLIVAVITMAVLVCYKRPRTDIFMELVVWPNGDGYVYPDPGRSVILHRLDGRGNRNLAYHFALEGDGTLVRYSGISQNYYNLGKRDFMRRLNIHERKEIYLSDTDFQNVVNMTWLAVDAVHNNKGGHVWTQTRIAMLYDGNIYGGWQDQTIYLHDLMNELRRLMR